MLNTRNRLINAAIIFSFLELALGIMVQTTSGMLNTTVSFAAIVLACAFAALMFTRTRDYVLTQLALVCTVFADLFLVVMSNPQRELAMLFFSVTQICYFLRIYFNQSERIHRKIHLILRICIIVVALTLTVIILKEKTDFLSLISLFYYANLVMNVVFAFTQIKKNIIFPIGLFLFAMCDMFIGFGVLGELYFILEKGTLLYWLANPGFNLAWVFYVPSQACLSLSLLKPKCLYLQKAC